VVFDLSRPRKAYPIRPPLLNAGNFVSEDHAMIWFERPPVCVIDWAKPGKIRQVSSVEAAGRALLKWPKTKRREKAATLLADAMEGTADMARCRVAVPVSVGTQCALQKRHTFLQFSQSLDLTASQP
jgi:hypothetical protein